MSFSVKMPALGESVSEGTVTRWLKKEGDQVAIDEPLLEVSTDKVDTEIPSPVAGTLEKILIQVDTTVAVGTDLALISEGATTVAAPVVAAPVVAAPVVAAPVVAAPVVAAPVVAAPA
ncbi:MAG: 2-oxoglutarate dehydrogenase, E2 component, dihydrolipoamide succinyltransferase, partial [Actinobacteria bacterium]|nr:2-oxoglutarate dehydrogenase, E2 component, dihydrolipoamide succinyltransferase [Actinomycetota bacterium]